VYIDLEFFDELRQKFGAPGEFAQALCIGARDRGITCRNCWARTADEAAPASQPVGEKCTVGQFRIAGRLPGGCMGQHDRKKGRSIDQNDIAAGLRAAAAVGDDRLQRMATGRVSPESFTHGLVRAENYLVPPRPRVGRGVRLRYVPIVNPSGRRSGTTPSCRAGTPVIGLSSEFTSMEWLPPDCIAPSTLPVRRSIFCDPTFAAVWNVARLRPIQRSPPGVIFSENVLPKSLHSPM